MTDRNVQYPSRYKLTLVEGTSDVYELTPAPGEVSAEGTILNKANLLSDNTAQALGLPQADPTVNDALNQLSGKQDPWQLIDLLDNTGEMAGTWTAPDVFEGENYDLGVYMIAGGGSGGAISSGATYRAASGGASGCGKNLIINNVAPNTQFTYVIGEGAAARSVSNSNNSGNSGGTTSFNNVEADGGEGGEVSSGSSSNSYYTTGASGGQGSDGTCQGGGPSVRLLYGCCPAVGWSPSGAAGASQSPREGQNQFDPNMVTLCAGGYAYNSTRQVIASMPDGTKGGNGGANANGENATGHGNGGGASVRSSGTATSGSGSDGAIYLYARRRSPVEYQVSITVLDQDSNPVDGIAINGLYSNAEGSRNGLAVTGSNGVATGISYQQQATFTTDAYTDLTAGSVSLVMTEGSVTEGTINVTFTNFVQWTASGTARFSHYVKRVDVSAVGAGGGGGGATALIGSNTGYSGQGGAGGYTAQQTDVDFDAETDYEVTVGTGGTGGAGTTSGSAGVSGEAGSQSSFLGVSANGGTGGLGARISGYTANNTGGNGYGAGGVDATNRVGYPGGAGTQSYYTSLTATSLAGGGGGSGAVGVNVWSQSGGAGGSPHGGKGGDGVEDGYYGGDEYVSFVKAGGASPGAQPGGGGGGGAAAYNEDTSPAYGGWPASAGGTGGPGIVTCRLYNTHTLPTS